MKILGFSLEHCGEGRVARFEHLKRVLDELSRELAVERVALRVQHENACADAAFAQDAMDNGEGSPQISAEIDRLTATIAARASNFAELDEQVAFVEATRQRLARLSLAGATQTSVGYVSGWRHLAS